MNIFILEDDIMQQQALKHLLEQFIRELKPGKINILTSSCPQHFLEQFAEYAFNNLYFLDISLGKQRKAGLELAEKIRKSDPYGIINFVTTYSEFLPLTYEYKVAALHFIRKDNLTKYNSEILDSLKTAIEFNHLSISDDSFILKSRYTDLQIPYKDILYFETKNLTHKISLVTQNKHCEFYGSLKEVVIKDDRLFKCHQSFVVNLQNISYIDHHKRIVYFDTNNYCLVARSKIRELSKRFESQSNL